MIRTTRFAIGSLAALAVGLLAIYLLSQLQPYEQTIDHGAAPEVEADPYLAAELFLRQRKIAVSRADGIAVLRQLPAAGQTLLLLSGREDMTPRQARQVLEWTARGGHLVFVAESVWDEEQGKSGDLLLDSLGIQQHLSEDLDDEDEGDSESDADAEASEDASADEDTDTAEQDEQPRTEEQDLGAAVAEQVEATDEDRYPQLTKLYLENEEAPAYVDFDTEFHLYDAQNRAHAWANSGKATHMLQLYHGDGLVTVLTDAWLWQNEHIDAYDNAWLLWYLSQDSRVTLIYSALRDSLLSQLLEHYPAALTALALLIALLLWHVGLRHGPLQGRPSHARRQLEEHLRGSADFLLRRSGQTHLLHSLQRDIQRRARHRHPGFERLVVAEQWQVLGRLTRIPTSVISQAMRPASAPKLSAADFTRQVANLQTLRNAL